jgi:hypothetical protein
MRVTFQSCGRGAGCFRRDALLKSVPNASVRFMPAGLSFEFSVSDFDRTPAHAFSDYDAGCSSTVKMNSGD